MRRCGVRLPLASWNTKPMPRPRTRGRAVGAVQQLEAVESHGTRRPAVRREQPGAGEQELALAGAGLADDCEPLARRDREVDAVDRADVRALP